MIPMNTKTGNIVNADYGQVEARIVAQQAMHGSDPTPRARYVDRPRLWLALDEFRTLCNSYNLAKPKDLHTWFASRMWGILPAHVDETQRGRAKAILYSYTYGVRMGRADGPRRNTRGQFT